MNSHIELGNFIIISEHMDTELSVIRRCAVSLIKQFDYKKKELNAKILKELVSTIRKVDGIIPAFIDVLFEHLRREDCDLRLGILLIANHFFQRSHNFRLELITYMQDFLVYTLETDPIHYPLPKPAEAAAHLKQETLAMLRLWIEKFGPGYPKLSRLGNFLKNSKSFDWENSETNLQIDRERAENERFKRDLRERKVNDNIKRLFEEGQTEIERIQVEAHSLTELLFPHFCQLDAPNSAANDDPKENNEIPTQFRPLNEAIKICINANEIEIENTSENVDLLNQLMETTKQLEKWHNKVSNWLGKLTEIGPADSTLTKRLIDARRGLAEEWQKCREFKVTKGMEDGGVDDNSSCSDSDNDFLDVEEKEGYEPEMMEEPGPSTSAYVDKPCTSSTCLTYDRPGPSGSKFTKHSNVSGINCSEKSRKDLPPKLAMGLDLKYWGEDGITPAQRIQSQTGDDCFWRPADHGESAPTEDIETYRSRQITFISDMPAIHRMCRAPLPSGKLCPRVEYHRCALHGPIIDRDEQGFPQTEQRQLEKQIAHEIEERQRREEEEYLRDVEAATGRKLTTEQRKKTMGNDAGGGRTARSREKPEYVKARERLQTKLFDKRALKRVTSTLEQIQKTRAERNFSHQFNYAVSNKR